MSVAQADAQQRLAGRYGGRADCRHEQAVTPQLDSSFHRPGRIAQHDRHDLADRSTDRPALLLQPVAQIRSRFEQAMAPFGLLLHDPQRLPGRGRGRLGRGGRKHVGPCPVCQPVDQTLRSGDEAADRSQGFAERTHSNMHPRLDAQVFTGTAAQPAEHARRMGFVDHQHGLMMFGQIRQVRQGGQISIHAEQGVRHDQPSAKPTSRAQPLAQDRHLTMRIDDDLGPG